MLRCSKSSLVKKKIVLEKTEKQEIEIAEKILGISMEKLHTIR